MAYTKFVLDIPKEYKPIDRVRIGDLIVEHIVERTQKGVDKKGKEFIPYSDKYINSLDFNNAGKSPSKVDLQLTGDMLAELSLLRHRSGQLTIGYDSSNPEAGKVKGHVTGVLGLSKKKYQRDFLGIDKKEVKRLITLYIERKGKGL